MIIIENILLDESYILNEGKKEAIRTLGKWVDFPLWEGKTLLDVIKELDPTPSNKYLVTLANIVKKELSYTARTQSYPTTEEDVHYVQRFLDTLFSNFKDIPALITKAEGRGFKKDISAVKDIDTLRSLLNNEIKVVSKQGLLDELVDLQEGKDYKVVFENKKAIGLMPFSWEASQVLASKELHGCLGDWCIGYTTTDEHWIDIVEDKGQAPVYVLPKNLKEKYAFMFHTEDSKFDIWDMNDKPLYESEKEELLNKLDLNSAIKQIRIDAIELAQHNIERFEEGSGEIVHNLNINSELDGDTFTAYADIEEITMYRGDREPDFGDSESAGYSNATIMLGKEFYSSPLGEELFTEILADDDDINTFPNILDECLVVDYGDTSTYTEMVEHASNNFEYDDYVDNTSDYLIGQLVKKNNIVTLIIISKEESSNKDDPFKHSSLSGADNFSYETDNHYFDIYTKATDTIADVIKKYPYIETIITGKWVPNEDQERKHGQQFFQYERALRDKRLKKLEELRDKKKS